MKSKSSTTIDIDRRFRRLPPLHAGEVLREEFLVPLKLSPYALAKALDVPRTRVERLVKEETALTADTALRLSRYFGTTAEFWLNLQAGYELECARQLLASKLAKITPRSPKGSAPRSLNRSRGRPGRGVRAA
jgi:antitoxin HigA-1